MPFESEFITWLRRRLPSHPQLMLGPGDDAAVLKIAAGSNCVVTTDAITEGVDFNLWECDPRRVGRKALAVNLSDLAAMAAQPLAVVVNLVLPRVNAHELAVALYEGLLPLAAEFGVAIAGGDTNSWDGGLVISITAIGETTARGPLTRAGAKPGDAILVTGEFGGSISGKQFDFQPRVREALLLHERYTIHAGTDVSDGLELDLAHLAEESGCGVLLAPDRIPISAAARLLSTQRADGISPVQHARTDGEDFELVLAVPPETAERLLDEQPLGVPLSQIGQFVSTPGCWEQAPNGERQEFVPRGFRH